MFFVFEQALKYFHAAQRKSIQVAAASTESQENAQQIAVLELLVKQMEYVLQQWTQFNQAWGRRHYESAIQLLGSCLFVPPVSSLSVAIQHSISLSLVCCVPVVCVAFSFLSRTIIKIIG